MRNQRKRFEKVTKDQNFYPKWLPNWAFRPVLYTFLQVIPVSIQSKIDVNPEETFKQNSQEPEFWLICASCAYCLHTYKSSSNQLINKVSSESSRNLSRNYKKTYVLTYFGPSWGNIKSRKIWPTGAIFHTHLKVPKIYACDPSFMVPYLKLENSQNPSKLRCVTYFL